MRLSPRAAGWTRGRRFESPDPVPTRTESRPSGPRSSRLRCRPAFAIPEPVRPLFVRGSPGPRSISVDTIFMTVPFRALVAYHPLHGMVQSGTPAFGGRMPLGRRGVWQRFTGAGVQICTRCGICRRCIAPTPRIARRRGGHERAFAPWRRKLCGIPNGHHRSTRMAERKL
jgi:hypothetical protein